ncbi:hypothetical protein MNBD_ALPHA12-1791 [hydrothermal vent metagenome]|uniref:Uncharacterized protein n=1 Tax=hydrothermal vent metagenome TaxID=652676 RepID=A0A3B0UEX6_9ZZZZ
MKQSGRKEMCFTFSSTDLLELGALFQTLGARLILPLNALQTLENHLVSSISAPVQEQNQLAQNG